jgi:hypothetical protein
MKYIQLLNALIFLNRVRKQWRTPSDDAHVMVIQKILDFVGDFDE